MCIWSVLPISLIGLPLHYRAHGDAKQQDETMMTIHKQTQENIKKAIDRYQQKANKHISAK